MKEVFESKLRLHNKNKEKLIVVNGIVEEYFGEGYTLTLRQLYYLMVSQGLIPNTPIEYEKLGSLLVRGRMAGVVDWSAIEDRVRAPFLPYWTTDPDGAMKDIINSYRLNRQKGQEVYIELWVEKDALSGFLSPITSYYHINLMVNRGYSSCSAMYDAFKRFQWQSETLGKCICILYVGDHDPSGLDMIRDVEDRMEAFGLQDYEVKHIALTMEQIKKYDPPPNPAKKKDSRFGWYKERHGEVSWEADALKPKVLSQVVKDNIEDLIDIDMFEAVLKREKKDRKKLEKCKKSLHKKPRKKRKKKKKDPSSH